MIRTCALVIAATLFVLLTKACTKSESRPDTTLRFALASEFGDFDPLHAGSTTDQILQAQIYEGLCEYVPGVDDFSVRGLLAESWTVSADGLTWQFKLRTDAFFFDPSPNPLWPNARRRVTAADVEWSWQRMLNPTAGGAGAFAFDLVESMRTIDDETFEVVLANQDPSWLQRLASPYAVIYPQEAVARSALRFGDNPVGSAPYYLSNWEPPHLAVFSSTPDWASSRGAAPEFSRVEFLHVPEASTRTLMFQRGEIDRLPPLQDAFDSLLDGDQPNAELRARGVTLVQTDTPDLTMIMFNMNDPVIGDIPGDVNGNQRRVLLRKALAAAFPYQQWNTVLRNGKWASPALRLLPPSLTATALCKEISWRREDRKLARELLAQAGWPDGEGLATLHLELGGADSASIDLGRLVQSAWQSIGIRCEFHPQGRAEFSRKLNQGKAQIFTWAWSLDWPDAGNLLQVFHSANSAPGINKSNFRNQEFDFLFAAWSASNDSDERNKLAAQMVAIIDQYAPLIPVDHRRSWLLISSRLFIEMVNPFAPMPCRYFKARQ